MMRVAILLSMLAAVSAFGVQNRPTAAFKSAVSTPLYGIPEGASSAILDRQSKAERWTEIRVLSQEEADAQLSGEELEAYNRYHAEIREGVAKLEDIAKLMLKSLEPPTVKPKGKKQRKRDKWARKQKHSQA